MTDLFFRFLSISVIVSVLSLPILLFFGVFGKRFSAKCRYIVWSLLLIRLLIPVGSIGTPIFKISLPAEASVTVYRDTPTHESEPEGIVSFSGEKAPDITEPMLEEKQTQEEAVCPGGSGEAVVIPSVSVPTEEVILPLPSVTEPYIPEYESDVVLDTVYSESTDVFVTEVEPMPESAPGQSEPAAPVPAGKSYRITLSDVLVALSIVWVIGAAVCLSVKLGSYASYLSSIKKSGMLTYPEENIRSLYCKAVSDMGLKRAPRLLVSSESVSPMLVGYFKPTVILSKISVSNDGLYRIIMHELTHYRRGDLWMKLASAVAESLYWFNPMIRFITANCAGEMELSCDEATLAGLGEVERVTYGEAVLAIVKNGKKKQNRLTTSFSSDSKTVKKRFESIIDGSLKRRGKGIVAIVIVMCILSGSVVAFSDDDTNNKRPFNDTSVSMPNEKNDGDTEKDDIIPSEPQIIIPSFKIKTAGCRDMYSEKLPESACDYIISFNRWDKRFEVSLCTVRKCEDGCSADEIVDHAVNEDIEYFEVELICEFGESDVGFYGTRVYKLSIGDEIHRLHQVGRNGEKVRAIFRSTVYLIPMGEGNYLIVKLDPAENTEETIGEREIMNSLISGIRIELADGTLIEPAKDCIHEYVETARDDASCTEEGSVSYRCNNCKGEKTEILGPDGHTPSVPTCTTHSVCTVCGVETASAAGHDFAPATTTSPKTCRVCGVTDGWPAIVIDTSDALGEHQFSAIRLFFCSDNTRPRWQYYKYIARTVRLTVNDIGYTVGEPDENGFYPVTFYGKTEKTYDDRDGLDISFTSKIYTKKQVEKEATGVNDFIPTMDFGTEVDMDTPDGTFVSATKYLSGGYYTVEIKDNPPQMYPPVDYEPLESLSIDLESFKKNTSDDFKFTDVPPKSEDLSVCIKEYHDPDTNAFRGDEIMSAVRIDKVSYTVDDFDAFDRYVVTLTFSGEVIYDNTDDDTAYVSIVVNNDKKGIGYVRNIPYSNFAAGSRVEGSVTLALEGADYRVYFRNITKSFVAQGNKQFELVNE